MCTLYPVLHGGHDLLDATWSEEDALPAELKVGEQEDRFLGDRPIRIEDDVLSVFVGYSIEVSQSQEALSFKTGNVFGIAVASVPIIQKEHLASDLLIRSGRWTSSMPVKAPLPSCFRQRVMKP